MEANPQKGALVKGSKGGKKKSQPLAITNDEEDDNDSMPSLETVSDTSEEWEESEDDDDESEDEESDSDDSAYDTDEEDEIRNMVREAMDEAYQNPDFFDPTKDVDESLSTEDRKSNPFMKLLGNLRGTFVSDGLSELCR